MHEYLPPRDALGEGPLGGQRDADAHDPEEGGEHQVPDQQPVPRGVAEPPVAARAVVHEDHQDYRDAGR